MLDFSGLCGFVRCALGAVCLVFVWSVGIAQDESIGMGSVVWGAPLDNHVKELDILRVVSLKNTQSAVALRVNLTLLHRQGQSLRVRVVLRLKKKGGGYVKVEDLVVSELKPQYKLHVFANHLIEIPFEKISISPGSHAMFLDIKLLDANGKVVAATINKDFTLVIPQPSPK